MALEIHILQWTYIQCIKSRNQMRLQSSDYSSQLLHFNEIDTKKIQLIILEMTQR